MATFKDMNLKEIIDDLSARFIINVPNAELASIERICFQIEQAHWYYQDFQCPLLHRWAENHEVAFANFMKYKLQVPVCGAIILNPGLDKILLVKGWKSKTWSFPKGKINENEKEVDCAVREVLEETGLDITPHLVTTGYLPKAPNADLNEPDHIETFIKECRMRLYFAVDVPDHTVFETQTINEIREIQWHSLTDIFDAHVYEKKHKNMYYSIAPFLEGIATWIEAKKNDVLGSHQDPAGGQDTSSPGDGVGGWVLQISPDVLEGWRNFRFDTQRLMACFDALT